MTHPDRPQGRYGAHGRTRSRRWRVWGFTIVALVTAMAVAWVGYRNIGSQPIEAQRTTYTELEGNAMRLTFQVSRDDPERAVVCVVRVREQDGAESGRREVLVPPREDGRPVTTVVQSSERPVTANVFGCSYDVPGYLTTR